MRTAEVYPLAKIGDSGPYPAWIRGLRHVSGVYIIRDLFEDVIAYVGESHTDRLYSTLTRHFQNWTNDYGTAGATYDREYIEVAVIVVDAEHAQYLQNELICILDPADNRLKCDDIFATQDDEEPTDEYHIDKNHPPPGYNYDVDRLIEAIAYQWPAGDVSDVPF